MNIRDLHYIIAVAQEENFTKAAEKVFVSQPTITMQIDKLEVELGVKIFERSRNKFLITPAGEEIIAKAEIVLREIGDITKIATRYSNPLEGNLKIGAFPTLAPYFFPKISNDLHKKFPKLDIFLVEEKTETLMEKLNNGELDLAFMAAPIIDDSLESISIFEEEFYLATPKDHKLAKKSKISVKDLRDQKLMLLSEGHCLRDQALEVCSIMGSFENQDFQASSLETLIEMIKIGSGITLIPKIAAQKNKKISYIKITNPPKREIRLYFRKTSVNKVLFEHLSQIIKNSI